MTRSKGPFKADNPWRRIGWSLAAGLVLVSAVLGFLVLSREQQNGPPLSPWAAICAGLGFTSSTRAADQPQPPLRTPTRIAWTRETFSRNHRANTTDGQAVDHQRHARHRGPGVQSIQPLTHTARPQT